MTTEGTPGTLTPEEERALVRELAFAVVDESAPEELVLFDETADDWFHDPRAALERRGDEELGFGLEDAVLLTPYVLAVATPVVRFLAEIVKQAARDAAVPAVTRLIRQLFRRRGAPDADAGGGRGGVRLSVEQGRRVREVAYAKARALGLPDGRAVLLADAVAGGLLTGP